MKQIYRSPILHITEIEEKDVITSSTENINQGTYGLGELEVSEW